MKNKIKKGNLIQRKLRYKKKKNSKHIWPNLEYCNYILMSTAIFFFKLTFNGFLNTYAKKKIEYVKNFVKLNLLVLKFG